MKLPHPEYKMVYRAGAFIDKDNLRREHEAAPIVFFCLAASALIVLAVMFQSCGLAGGIR